MRLSVGKGCPVCCLWTMAQPKKNRSWALTFITTRYNCTLTTFCGKVSPCLSSVSVSSFCLDLALGHPSTVNILCGSKSIVPCIQCFAVLCFPGASDTKMQQAEVLGLLSLPGVWHCADLCFSSRSWSSPSAPVTRHRPLFSGSIPCGPHPVSSVVNLIDHCVHLLHLTNQY